MNFKTRFRKPESWYMELNDEGAVIPPPVHPVLRAKFEQAQLQRRLPRWVLCGNTTSANSWVTPGGTTQRTQRNVGVGSTLDEWHAVTNSASTAIACLLGIGVTRSWVAYSDASSVQLESNQSIDGRDHYSLRIESAPHTVRVVCVDTATALVRRIVETRQIDAASVFARHGDELTEHLVPGVGVGEPGAIGVRTVIDVWGTIDRPISDQELSYNAA